jgi:hypothetical protein
MTDTLKSIEQGESLFETWRHVQRSRDFRNTDQFFSVASSSLTQSKEDGFNGFGWKCDGVT